MTPERWKLVEEIFQTALDLAPDEREGYLSEASARDDSLRSEVEALIAQYEEAGEFIEEPALAANPFPSGITTLVDNPYPSDSEDPMAGQRLGAYAIVREIGRGGMGAVYLAARADSEFQKQVAIKLVKRGMDTDFILRRFRNERQILATLDHPNIGRLLDGGTTDDGRPYFVMEYIEGQPLHYFCDTKRLSIRERLELFTQVCSAVHYAHKNFVIHRDIKPSNILVTAEGAPKLLDFGIAKLLNTELAFDTAAQTATAMRLMTPEYASPEQTRGEPVTRATDVYSLGVLLYETVTGHRPYRLHHRAPHEITRVICEEMPVNPSIAVSHADGLLWPTPPRDGMTALDFMCESRGTTLEALRREVEGNLDNIIMKTLYKEPQRRYQSVELLREDILQHLRGNPVSAPSYFPVSAPKAKPSTVEPSTGEKSIAILPLKLLNPMKADDTGDDYLGVGLADALITRLSNVRRFIVRPTSSVLRYSDGDTDPFVAGQEIGVDYIVDGNIRRIGEVLRVTVQLLSVSDHSTQWAGRFDEKFTDVLQLEDAISEQIASALVPQLTGDEREQLAKRGTNNAEAYEAYLRGRYHWNTPNEANLVKAIAFYNRAVLLDPNYALAYAGIADYYNMLGVYGVMPFADVAPKAKDAALKSVALDDTLAAGYAALGFAALMHDFDWEAAEEHLRRSMALNPNYALGRLWYGYFFAMAGRAEEALDNARRSLELDPSTPMIQNTAIWVFYLLRLYDEAIEMASRVATNDPQYGLSYVILCLVLLETGRYQEAIEAAQNAIEVLGRIPYTLTRLASAYAGAGQREAAHALLEEMQLMSATRYVSPNMLATVYVHLQDYENAFAELERALEIRDARLIWLGVDPQFEVLRGDPRFTELLRRTNNPALHARFEKPATGERDFSGRRVTGEAQTGQKSIAILPFKLINPAGASGTGDDYLGVGLSDALVTRLSAVRRFIVRPTSSVLRYGSGDVDPLDAGRELGVEYIIGGTIRIVGERIRVTAQLLNVSEGATRWAGTFDEKATDVLQLEDSISMQVASALVPHLTGDEHHQLKKRGTENAEAFEAFLRGRYHWYMMTGDGLAKSLANYERAIALDPFYAAPYAGIAEYHCWLAVYGLMPPAECMAAAREAAERAIELDDTLAEAHTAHGLALLNHESQWKLAETRFRRAIELNPNYTMAHAHYACQLAMESRFDESINTARRACELDPLNAFNAYFLTWCLYQARRYDEGIMQGRLLLQSEPRYGAVRMVLSWMQRRKGNFEEAIEEARKGVELLGEIPMFTAALGAAYAEAGKIEEARRVLAELRERSAKQYVSPYHLAFIYIYLGETNTAFELLEQAVESGEPWLVWLATEPQFDTLRGHPRFDSLLRQTNNPAAPQQHVTASESATGEKSVAVLPLKVMSFAAGDNTGDEYLGVGLADALITRLSNVHRFIVRPTTSVLRYQGQPTDPLKTGRELGVDYIVDGSIRRAGGRIRVTAQLLHVGEGATRWAENFDADFTDVLDIEDSISEQIAGALVSQLTSEERIQLKKRGTDDPEAYEVYLRGRYYWNTFTEEGFAKALVCYNRAIALDTEYAQAYTGIADYYNLLGVYAVLPFAETSAAAIDAALTAIKLDDNLAEAYSALGFATLTHDFDWQMAERYLRRATELNPNYATGRLWYCYFLGMAGRFDEALAQVRRALELDPLTPLVHHALTWTYFHARRYEESIAAVRKLAKNEPQYGMGHVFMCLVLLHTGAHEEAIEAGQKAVALLGRTPYTLFWLASACAAAGEEERARTLVSEIEELAAVRYVSPYLLAMVHLNLGDREQALTQLERALEIRDGRLAWLGVDPQFDSLRSEPRFTEVLRKTNNPAPPRKVTA